MSKVALLFPGQGSQYVGMAKSLCDSFTEARHTFEEANDVLGFDLKYLCFNGSMEELTRTENTQPALLTASVAAYRVYMKETGVDAAFMAGHSLGEFSALCCAGGIKFSDAVRIVRQRGKFMQEAVPVGIGGMVAIGGVAQGKIEEVCSQVTNGDKLVVVSNYNSPDQIVISGHLDSVNEAGEKLKAFGARVIPLKVSAPFHSPLMKPAAEMLSRELKRYDYGALAVSVLSNVTAKPYPGPESVVELLTKQIVNSVRWQESMQYLHSQGVDLAIEIGPQAVLKNLMKKNAPQIKAFSYDDSADIAAVKKIINSGIVNGEDIKQGMDIIIKCIATVVSTKNSNWNEDEYRKEVVEPYRKIKAIKEEIIKDGRQPYNDEIKEVLQMLKGILISKKIPMDQTNVLLKDIIVATGTEEVFGEFTA